MKKRHKLYAMTRSAAPDAFGNNLLRVFKGLKKARHSMDSSLASFIQYNPLSADSRRK